MTLSIDFLHMLSVLIYFTKPQFNRLKPNGKKKKRERREWDEKTFTSEEQSITQLQLFFQFEPRILDSLLVENNSTKFAQHFTQPLFSLPTLIVLDILVEFLDELRKILRSPKFDFGIEHWNCGYLLIILEFRQFEW